MLIGYVRVSTNDQNTELQRNALESTLKDKSKP
ncbi:recombinase family protein, partial [Escherichia coli]